MSKDLPTGELERDNHLRTRSYHFGLGAFECIVVSDGTHTVRDPTPILFANAPRERLRQVLRAHSLDPERWKEHISTYPGLVLKTGNRRVLVDTGAGDLMPGTGKLIPNLRAEGQLSLLDDEMELVSGIRVVSAPGHTPGHMAVVISSNHEQLICISDAALHPIHLL